MARVFLAVDLGASSGRVVAGSFDGARLSLMELHRFVNGPVLANGTMYWDVLRLWSEIQEGLRLAKQRFGSAVTSVAVDTWGVDFGLLDRDDRLLGNPVHYRDPRTHGMMGRAFERVSREEIFRHTGLQFMELNTVYQLLSMRLANSAALEHARTFLMMPDLFHWFLTGVKSNEFTNATTTQCFDPVRQTWSTELLAKLDIHSDIFLPVSMPGTVLGPLHKSVAAETGLHDVRVVLPGSHDTASAVLAVPTSGIGGDWCYISSGTWSLMGVESPRPVITDTCAKLNFTNEGGVGGTTRLLKNIGGLWLIQECRRIWHLQGHDYAWDDLVDQARGAAPLVSVIDPDHPDFLAPGDMPAAMTDFCQRTRQPVPSSHGAVVRMAFESLALRYRQVLGWLESLTGNRLNVIHIVGGGAHNQLLCQMAADACQRDVLAGPVEATAIGNIVSQLIASGEVASIAEARQVVRASFDVAVYQPTADGATKQLWDDAFHRFTGIVQS